jgi:probable rRNA maturation factor
MNVKVTDSGSPDIDENALANFASSILMAQGVDEESSVVIQFVDDETIAALNEEHLGKAGPTDVLSFPIEDATPGSPPIRIEGAPPLDLGDIFISTNVVQQHAAEFEVSFSDELHLMVCHGLLHLLGWDHLSDSDAEAMERRESELLATIGIERR